MFVFIDGFCVAKSAKKATIMLAPERGVSSQLRSNIGARVGNVGEKEGQHVSKYQHALEF
jgi:hypothetical protein